MANSAFARQQLLKHGWTEGSGLGKEESGIKEAIKVKIKHDNTGVGHDPGKEFTCHWWDHVFNKAANSITVETTQDGVSFKKSEEAKQQANTLSSKGALYSGFVKGAVLQASEDNIQTEISCHDDSDVESNSEDEDIKAISKLTEEELFSQCEGRTAHKGARHGLKQNAKLLRIQEQEKMLMKQMRLPANQKEANKSLANQNHQQSSAMNVEEEQGLVESTGISEVEPLTKKKKKRSKRKAEDLSALENEISTLVSDPSKLDDEKEPGVLKKKKKKSKRKTEDLTICENNVVSDLNVNDTEEVSDASPKKKHKKSKKKKRMKKIDDVEETV